MVGATPPLVYERYTDRVELEGLAIVSYPSQLPSMILFSCRYLPHQRHLVERTAPIFHIPES